MTEKEKQSKKEQLLREIYLEISSEETREPFMAC